MLGSNQGIYQRSTTVSRLKDIRTDVSIDVSLGAGTVVGEARELAAADQPEVILNDVLAS